MSSAIKNSQASRNTKWNHQEVALFPFTLVATTEHCSKTRLHFLPSWLVSSWVSQLVFSDHGLMRPFDCTWWQVQLHRYIRFQLDGVYSGAWRARKRLHNGAFEWCKEYGSESFIETVSSCSIVHQWACPNILDHRLFLVLVAYLWVLDSMHTIWLVGNVSIDYSSQSPQLCVEFSWHCPQSESRPRTFLDAPTTIASIVNTSVSCGFPSTVFTPPASIVRNAFNLKSI